MFQVFATTELAGDKIHPGKNIVDISRSRKKWVRITVSCRVYCRFRTYYTFRQRVFLRGEGVAFVDPF